MRLTCSTFTLDFAIKPWSKSLRPKDQRLAWAITIIAGIFTAGFFQLGCLIASAVLKKRGFKSDKTIEDIFQAKLPGAAQTKKHVLLTSFFDGSPEKYAKPVRLIDGHDLSGEEWFNHIHLRLFAVPFLYSQTLIDIPNVGVRDFSGQGDQRIVEQLEKFLLENPSISEKKYVAYPLLVLGKHFALVFIDCEKRVIEIYDSFVGQFDSCSKIADLLTAKDPGKSPYKVKYKIEKPLQSDGYQCGPWVCFFLEQKIKNPDFDFNSLKQIFDPAEIGRIMALYRNKITWKILEYQKQYAQWYKTSCENFSKKYANTVKADNNRLAVQRKMGPQELINAVFEGRVLVPENG